MSYMATNTVTIDVGGTFYNSLSDFGLAINNTDYIGDAVQGEAMAWAPGRSGPLDFIDGVFGGQYYLYREIVIKFGGLQEPEDWDAWISNFRDILDGRWIKIYFATDIEWYYQGRASVRNFSHKRALGTFELHLPYADPFKHRDRSISFASTAIGKIVNLSNKWERVVPTITTDASVVVTLGNTTKTLAAGTHQDPDFTLSAGVHQMSFVGAANVSVSYREGSL